MKKTILVITSLIMVLVMVIGTTGTATAAKPISGHVTITSVTETTVSFDFDWNKVKNVDHYQINLTRVTDVEGYPAYYRISSYVGTFNWDSKKPSSNVGSESLDFIGNFPVVGEAYNVTLLLYDVNNNTLGTYFSETFDYPYAP